MRERPCVDVLAKKLTLQEEEKHRALPNDAVRREFHLAPLATELQIQRIRWYESMAEHPEENDQLLTLLLGTFPKDTPTTAQHPWLQQMREDFKDISTCEIDEDLEDALAASSLVQCG